MTDSKFHETLGCEGDPSSALSQAGQGGQGEVVCQLCGLDGQWRDISKSLFDELRASGHVSNLRVLHAAQTAPAVPATVASAAPMTGTIDDLCDPNATDAEIEAEVIASLHAMKGEFTQDDADIEAIIACLGDDAATLRDESPEIADNLDAAAEALRKLAQQTAPAVPADFLTHQGTWREALVLAERNAKVQAPDLDDKAYWRHELAAYDRAYAELLSAAPKPEQAAVTVGASLLRQPLKSIADISKTIPGGCYCPPGTCQAPIIMGRQTPCLRRTEDKPEHGEGK